MRVVEELKAEGIMKAVDRVDTLPIVVEGLMTIDYEEIYEI
jgi:hypothetical protein